MSKFIYVFTKDASNALLSAGYALVNANNATSVYVFENRRDLKFELSGNEFSFSNMLIF